MASSQLTKRPAVLLMAPLLTSMMLVSCSAAPGDYGASSAPETDSTSESLVAQGDGAPAEAPQDLSGSKAEGTPRKQPQLIKTAEMVLQVETVESAVKSVSKVVKEQQGDILGLQDEVPANPSQRQTASMELRIPQAKLDTTLDRLTQLGEVQSRSIQAQDVSNQLVDFQARLRNLRKSEEQVLKILDRSGSVADVLKVTQELSNIRASIEQIDAQLQRLQNQVAYSTVRLTLKDAIASSNRQPVIGDSLKDSWAHSTRAMRELTVGLLSLGVWLLAFSPYFIGLFLLGFAGKHLLFRRSSPPAVHPTSPPADS
ncbi:hypothetical protein C1752_01035 [Acaryochloris thomasi RCC1774]|uniref:DUF4349 domain-containing protein n=1 Tax=Acaryochloris thomasi RCC1774 TaxID=1764569 RepID=A0A2W1JMY7_9CYAN|nr:DUF4349 domain-containing protein [Acaryochloris thomasi]PZD74649.1 hypothetical protein C1752_01035 [Acaryochloris thomasi RCC1774]